MQVTQLKALGTFKHFVHLKYKINKTKHQHHHSMNTAEVASFCLYTNYFAVGHVRHMLTTPRVSRSHATRTNVRTEQRQQNARSEAPRRSNALRGRTSSHHLPIFTNNHPFTAQLVVPLFNDDLSTNFIGKCLDLK